MAEPCGSAIEIEGRFYGCKYEKGEHPLGRFDLFNGLPFATFYHEDSAKLARWNRHYAIVTNGEGRQIVWELEQEVDGEED